MFGRKNGDILHQVSGRERGHLEMLLAQKAVLDAQYLGILKSIAETKGLKKDFEFDSKRMAFIRAKQPQEPQQPK